MTRFESFCVTGTAMVYNVLPDFAAEYDENNGQQEDLGSLDAPKYMPAGSMLTKCWYGINVQRITHRDERS